MNQKEKEVWEKGREPVTVSKELKARILSMVDSNYMREYLAKDGEYNIFNWVELIGSSPRSMDLKLELLRELLQVPMNEEARRYLQGCIVEADSAMEQLYHMDLGQSVLLAYYMHSEYVDAFADYADPCRSYEEFLDHARENLWEEDGPLEEQSDYQGYYYMLNLYDVVDGKYEKLIAYFCPPNGKVQYYHREREVGRPSERDCEQERREEPFAGLDGLQYWTAPYQVGDILYVDMRPYFKPTFCLISWLNEEMPHDCCAIRCVYLTVGGMVEERAFKHGHFLPHMITDPYDRYRQFYSPFYRAELFAGELPEEYAFMKTLSEQLKEDPELSQQIDDAFCKCTEKYCRPEICVYRPAVVKNPDWNDDEDTELDVIWHPERKEREWWEDLYMVNGMTKEQLLEIAGCSEPEDGSASEKKKED